MKIMQQRNQKGLKATVALLNNEHASDITAAFDLPPNCLLNPPIPLPPSQPPPSPPRLPLEAEISGVREARVVGFPHIQPCMCLYNS